jgi:hypothetical protein
MAGGGRRSILRDAQLKIEQPFGSLACQQGYGAIMKMDTFYETILGQVEHDPAILRSGNILGCPDRSRDASRVRAFATASIG